MSDDYFKASTKFMISDLAKSGLDPADMGCVADEVNSDPSKEKRVLISSSYIIPFYDLDGAVIPTMWRRRRELLPGADRLKGLGKYTQPHITMAEGYGNYPYIPRGMWEVEDGGGVLHLCEGEKKTACLTKMAGVRAVGLTGKDVSVETVKVICEVIRKLGDVVRICIWPDADVRRFDVVRSYGKLRARLLEQLWDVGGLTVDVMQPGWDARKFKGIDDALVGGWKFDLAGAGVVGEELPIDLRALADRVGLDYTVSDKGVLSVTINEDNICRTIEDRDMWGELSLNRDNGRWLSGDDELLPEIEVMSFTRRLQRVFGMKKVSSDLVGKCVDHVCRLSERSPWADWLAGLEWDGEKRLGGWLSRACGAVAGDEFIAEAGTKWLVGAVARAMKPGVAVDWMLILSGPQGCGKSSLPRALMPPEFAGAVMMAPGGHDKDLQQAAGMCRVLMFDEMATWFNRRDDTEFIKQFVTAVEDVYRPPYGRATTRVARGCVLYGSTNHTDAIRGDATGYRRWVVIGAQGVKHTRYGPQFDWKWLEDWREQLWAEAVAEWRAGLDYSQVMGASARALDSGAVVIPEEYDQFLAVLAGNLSNVSLWTTKADGRVFINNPAMYMAYQQMWGREPNKLMLRRFWEHWDCPTEDGARRIRGRVLSERLVAVLAGGVV